MIEVIITIFVIIIINSIVMIDMTEERKGMVMWRSSMVKTVVTNPSWRSGLSCVPILDVE